MYMNTQSSYFNQLPPPPIPMMASQPMTLSQTMGPTIYGNVNDPQANRNPNAPPVIDLKIRGAIQFGVLSLGVITLCCLYVGNRR